MPKDPNFSIIIPKLGANANVVANVDSANPDQYLPALEAGVAHAAGTKFPGERGHIYLFAHSTNTFTNVSRFNAIFYLLYKLEPGDEINVYYQGVRHTYHVTGKAIVDPSEVEYITRTSETETLTLQTCWPPGTIAQRMLIFAQ
ncbi:MAG: Sortase family protein [Microgenomates bacterium OLB23]|nr:MAG: Sortase family protein [Microgenomates bacterium OLB23]